MTDIYTNSADGIIASFDTGFDREFEVILNTSGNILYTFITDNEIHTLEGTATITSKPPEEPKNQNQGAIRY